MSVCYSQSSFNNIHIPVKHVMGLIVPPRPIDAIKGLLVGLCRQRREQAAFCVTAVLYKHDTCTCFGRAIRHSFAVFEALNLLLPDAPAVSGTSRKL